MRVLERSIEAEFVRTAKALGCLVYKLTERNAPDRIVITPLNDVFFVELKRKGENPRPEQLYEHNTLRARELEVFVVDSRESGIHALSKMLYGSERVLSTK